MVAISIDKYLAIVYPMRPRMTKNQAKIIIMVIWSAALVTSLPIAILSRLRSEFATIESPSLTHNAEAQTNLTNLTTNLMHLDHTMSGKKTISDFTLAHQNTTALKIAYNHSHQIQPNDTKRTHPIQTFNEVGNHKLAATKPQEPKSELAEVLRHQLEKFFCQEDWLFWPAGKYYYSMMLMILQFVLPLVVLVITYTRIVIIVWGKKVPGEEDNARDARMARSKRKVSLSDCNEGARFCMIYHESYVIESKESSGILRF